MDRSSLEYWAAQVEGKREVLRVLFDPRAELASTKLQLMEGCKELTFVVRVPC